MGINKIIRSKGIKNQTIILLFGVILGCNSSRTTDKVLDLNHDNEVINVEILDLSSSYRDSLLIQNIESYYKYLDSTIKVHGDNIVYDIYVKTIVSNDTVSYLINGNIRDDIFIYMADDFRYIYKINNHRVYTKEKVFTFKNNLNIVSELQLINQESYDLFKKGKLVFPSSHWDIKFLYIVLQGDSILRNEIRFYSSSPPMFSADF